MNKDLPESEQIALWARQAITHRRDGYPDGVTICMDAIEEIVYGAPDRPLAELIDGIGDT